MKTGMNLDKAKTMIAAVVAGRKRMGRNYSPPWRMDEVLDALVVVHDSANLDAPSAEEVTLLRRQLAACQNREKARKNKDLDKGNENPSPVDDRVDHMTRVPDQQNTDE